MELQVANIMAKINLNAAPGTPDSFSAAPAAPWPVPKHAPFIDQVHTGEYVLVGVAGAEWAVDAITFHPQTPQHYTSSVFLKDSHGVVTSFTDKMANDGYQLMWQGRSDRVQPFAVCNLHGVFEGIWYTVL
jgi:desulfoferrodoxin (superoxide reductase-like protein)